MRESQRDQESQRDEESQRDKVSEGENSCHSAVRKGPSEVVPCCFDSDD